MHAVFRISPKNRAMAAEYLRPLGLYPGQELLLLLLLLLLAEGERRSQQELVDALGIDHSTVTKMLQRLERAGVVARQQSADGRRVVLVHLTEEGCVRRLPSRRCGPGWRRSPAAACRGNSMPSSWGCSAASRPISTSWTSADRLG